MRTAIKLILLNLLIAQIIAPILVMIPCVIYLVATTGNLDKDALISLIAVLIFVLFLVFLDRIQR